MNKINNVFKFKCKQKINKEKLWFNLIILKPLIFQTVVLLGLNPLKTPKVLKVFTLTLNMIKQIKVSFKIKKSKKQMS